MRRTVLAGLVAAVLLPLTPLTAVADAAPAARRTDAVTEKLAGKLDRLGGDDEVRVIVTLTSDATPGVVDRLEAAAGPLDGERRLDVIDGLATTVTKEQVADLAALPNVVSVEEDLPVKVLNDGAQSSFGVGAARTDVPGLDGDADGNPNAFTANDLVAAVVDTGIDPTHLDLDEGKVIAFKDLVGGKTTAYDDNGHGTHVAASIAGDGDARADHRNQGVAPGAALVGVKVLDAAGSGYMSTVTAGIDWVVANRATYGIEAINLSLGSTGCSNGTDATSRAVDNAVAAGLVVAVAAGNEGPNACTVGSPGAAARGITVGAMADTTALGFKQASFSSRGPTADGRVKPDISAPGVSISSAVAGSINGYASWNGTSMATPFVTGVSLLLRELNPTLTPDAVKALLMSTAVDWGVAGADNDYGAGRLDAHRALTSAAGIAGSPPVVPSHVAHTGTLPGTGAALSFPLQVTATSAPIAATLIETGAATYDFDVELRAPDGTRVAVAETGRRQDELGFQPTSTGLYTVRVWSYSGSGPFVLDLSAVTGPPPDLTPPTVTASSPAAGATVAVGATVSTSFSEAMDQGATAAALSVSPAGGAPVAGTTAWSGTTLTFTPASPLAEATSYTATVGTAAADVAGNHLAAPVSWTFNTEAPAPPPPPPPSTVTVTKAPGSVTILEGSVRSGGASRLVATDGTTYQINSTTSGTRASAWYGRFTGVTNDLSNATVAFTGSTTRSCQHTLAVWSWATSSWVTLDTRTATSVTLADLVPPGSAADYVSGTTGTGEVRVRSRCSGPTKSFVASGDFLQLRYEQPA